MIGLDVLRQILVIKAYRASASIKELDMVCRVLSQWNAEHTITIILG